MITYIRSFEEKAELDMAMCYKKLWKQLIGRYMTCAVRCRREWNLMRVARRGTEPPSDWLHYKEVNLGFAIRLR